MNSPSSLPDPSPAPDELPTRPLPALDATVEMDRPAIPHASAPAGDPARYRRVRSATRRFEGDAVEASPAPTPDPGATIEMDRPADARPAMSAPAALINATLEMERPTATPVDIHATVEMPRAIDSKRLADQGSGSSSNLIATVEMVRPPDPRKTPLPQVNAFATNDAYPAQVEAERRETGRDAAVPLQPVAYAKKLGEVLVQMGKVTPEQIEQAVEQSAAAGERVGRWLIRWELVQPDTLCRALSIQTGLPMTMLDTESMPEELSKVFPLPLMMHHCFVPFEDSGAVLCVAACNPLDPVMLREQEKVLRKVIEVFLAREDQVARQLDWLRIRLKTRSRSSLRYAMRLTVSYQFCNRLGVRIDKEIHSGSTLNVSEGGYLVEGPVSSGDPGEMMRKGLYVNICIKLMTGEIWAICDVREIRLVDDPARGRWLLGVEVLDINPDSKTRLKALCRRPGKASA